MRTFNTDNMTVTALNDPDGSFLIDSPKLVGQMKVTRTKPTAHSFRVFHVENGSTPEELDGVWLNIPDLMARINLYLEKRPVSKHRAVKDRFEMRNDKNAAAASEPGGEHPR